MKIRILQQKIVHPIISCVLVQEAEVIIEDKKWKKKVKDALGTCEDLKQDPPKRDNETGLEQT